MNRGIRMRKQLFAQERDMSILQFVLEQTFVTLDQIALRFWLGVDDNPLTARLKGRCRTAAEKIGDYFAAIESIQFDENLSRDGRKKELAKLRENRRSAAYRRILFLQKFGLVKRVQMPFDRERVYQVTPSGVRFLEENDLEVLPYKGKINLSTYEHEKRVTDVRIISEIIDYNWLSCREMMSGQKIGGRDTRRVPDGVLEGESSRVAVEIEISTKRKERYEKIFREYVKGKYIERSGEIDCVLYVCKSPEQKSRLLKYASAAGSEHFWFCTYRELEQTWPETILDGVKGQQMQFNEF